MTSFLEKDVVFSSLNMNLWIYITVVMYVLGVDEASVQYDNSQAC